MNAVNQHGFGLMKTQASNIMSSFDTTRNSANERVHQTIDRLEDLWNKSIRFFAAILTLLAVLEELHSFF